MYTNACALKDSEQVVGSVSVYAVCAELLHSCVVLHQAGQHATDWIFMQPQYIKAPPVSELV